MVNVSLILVGSSFVRLTGTATVNVLASDRAGINMVVQTSPAASNRFKFNINHPFRWFVEIYRFVDKSFQKVAARLPPLLSFTGKFGAIKRETTIRQHINA